VIGNRMYHHTLNLIRSDNMPNELNFSSDVTEYAQTKNNLRLDFNYDSPERAKNYPDDCLWLQYLDGNWNDRVSVEISLEQAKWLSEVLPSYIKLLEGDNNAHIPERE
jgi:hypothetical protein